MTRLQADCLLGFAGLIWGFGFVAQKDALGHIGSFTFVAARFLLSALVVLPLVWRERKQQKHFTTDAAPHRFTVWAIASLCTAFALGVLLQQVGLQTASVTNTSFLTGIYVVLTPFVGGILYRHRILPATIVAAILSLLGIWLLAGGSLDSLPQSFGLGDALVLGCSVMFAFQVSIMGHVAALVRSPYLVSFLQYAAVGLIALILAIGFEKIDFQAIGDAWISILYAGIASGGVAYTLQAIAQQHTPSADTAIILSTESLFGGLGGVWLLGERLTVSGMIGCVAIIAAIVVVEIGPLWKTESSEKR